MAGAARDHRPRRTHRGDVGLAPGRMLGRRLVGPDGVRVVNQLGVINLGIAVCLFALVGIEIKIGMVWWQILPIFSMGVIQLIVGICYNRSCK